MTISYDFQFCRGYEDFDTDDYDIYMIDTPSRKIGVLPEKKWSDVIKTLETIECEVVIWGVRKDGTYEDMLAFTEKVEHDDTDSIN